MKSPLLIGVSALTLLTLSATLFAQTTTGSSLITEMKAAIRPFTLTADLNAGATGLQSAPLTGKRTGDQLSAAEYNRLLELVGQGGGVGGKFEITNATTKTNYNLYWAAAWRSSPSNHVVVTCATRCATLDTAAHDFCMISGVSGGEPHTALTYLGDKKYQLSVISSAGGSSSLSVVCYDNIGTGGASTSNIIKGTAQVGFTNGQPHSTMATISFGRTCTNPVITVQSVNDSIACGTGAGSGICSNSPGTTSEDLKAYFSGVTATDFKVYLSSMSGVWVGATSPQFGVNYIVVCD